MKDPMVMKDERTKSVENESYRLGFILLLFGLLIDILIRSLFYRQASWDLFALVIVSSWFSTIYQGRHKALPEHFLRSAVILGAMSAAVAFILVLILARVW